MRDSICDPQNLRDAETPSGKHLALLAKFWRCTKIEKNHQFAYNLRNARNHERGA